jgi:CheY-like chemotaxis protein
MPCNTLHGSKNLDTGMPLEQTFPRTVADAAARRRVLLVDDHKDTRRMLGIMLGLSGHEVLEAGDGREAVAVAVSERPDVAIVDIDLPGIDGYEVARRIRARPDLGGIVLIALTGYGYDEDLRCAIEAGFDVHLVKPVEPARLADAIVRGGQERRRSNRRKRAQPTDRRKRVNRPAD